MGSVAARKLRLLDTKTALERKGLDITDRLAVIMIARIVDISETERFTCTNIPSKCYLNTTSPAPCHFLSVVVSACVDQVPHAASFGPSSSTRSFLPFVLMRAYAEVRRTNLAH